MFIGKIYKILLLVISSNEILNITRTKILSYLFFYIKKEQKSYGSR